MKAKSVFGRSVQEISEKVTSVISAEFNPALVFVFLSDKTLVASNSAIFEKKNIAIFGVTASSSFTDEEMNAGLISALLLEMDRSHFRIVYETYEEGNAEKAARIIGSTGLEIFSNPAYIVSASHVNSPIDDILKGIKTVAGNQAIIIGGISSDDDLVLGGLVFTNNRIGSNAIISLIIDTDNVLLTGYAVSGWKPMGISKTITRSEGNRVFTIDNIPALDVIMKYTGIEVDQDDQSDIYTQVGTVYPFQVQKDTGTPIMNPPLLLNKNDHSVICGMNIPEGSKIKFSMPPDFEVIETVIEQVIKTKANEFPEADAMLIFSCVGRYNSFGPLVNTEIEGIQKVWDVPMAGFFSFGEFGRSPGGQSEVHGTTCSWMALKGK
jgi:hypothetical protein